MKKLKTILILGMALITGLLLAFSFSALADICPSLQKAEAKKKHTHDIS